MGIWDCNLLNKNGCIWIGKSEKQYNRHLCLDHELYSSGESIREETIKSLEKQEDRVLFLLKKYKEARSPHNWQLDKLYLKWFSPNHLLVYDDNAKRYQTNPKEGWDEEQVKLVFIEIAGVERSRRKLQERDGKMYHEEGKKDMPGKIKHDCILPSEQALIESGISQDAHREYYGK